MIKENKTIILTGTHITPAIELINQLKSDPTTNWEIHYIGRQYTSPIEKIPAVEYELIPQMGINYHIIDCGKLDRRYWPNTIMGLPKTIKGIFQAMVYVNQIKPNLTVSFGGYLSVPVIIASKLFKIKSITHEQTLTISLSTKINSFFADKIALSFNNTTSGLPSHKVVVTGNLLRREIFCSESKFFDQLIDHPTKPVLYVTAGSQGSHKINQAILNLLPILTKEFIIIHQTGKVDFEDIKKQTHENKSYYPFDYITPTDIGWVFNHADIIVSRSGANSTQEIAQFGIKSIIIPLPITQQDEQKKNADWLKSQQPHKTIIVDDLQLNPDLLLEAINKLKKLPGQKQINGKSTLNYQLLNLVNEIS